MQTVLGPFHPNLENAIVDELPVLLALAAVGATGLGAEELATLRQAGVI